MAHAFAFHVVGLPRLCVSILPGNQASQRMFEKLGYRIDNTSAARACADEDSDVTLSIAKERFEGLHDAAAAALRFSLR